MAKQTDQGLEKSALLLLTLGVDQAAEVLKFLTPREVQRLGTAMAQMQPQPLERVEALIEELELRAAHSARINTDEDAIRSMLVKVLGNEEAANRIGSILQGSDTAGIDSLKWMDASSAADLIKSEHPQIIATILVHLDADQAGEILRHFTERLRHDVLLRIATLDGVQPAALEALNDALARVLTESGQVLRKATLGGVRQAAAVLHHVGSAAEAAIIENVRQYDAELAQKILDEMFLFENLLDVDDRGIQVILREIQGDQLMIALRGASPEVREKIFKNMSVRAAEMLREDLESSGPVRLSQVEQAQRDILAVARRLSDDGEIMLGRKGDEDALV